MMEKLTAAYLRMNRRERTMTLVIVAILFLLINLFAWRLVLGNISNASGGCAACRSRETSDIVSWFNTNHAVMWMPAELA